MTLVNDFSVDCSWLCDQESLKKCLRIVPSTPADKLYFDPDEVSVENCLQLAKNENETSSCLFDLKAKVPGEIIAGFLVVSECKRIEVYNGKTGEYIGTYTGQAVEEASDEDMTMWIISVSEGSKLSSLRLKFVSIPDKESFWILSFKLKIFRRKEGAHAAAPPFDLTNFNKLIAGDASSEKAQSFKRLFEAFQTSPSQNQPTFPHQFAIQGGQGDNSSMVTAMKHISEVQRSIFRLEQKLEDVERKLICKIDEKAREQDEKLNEIMKMLQSLSKNN